jgi:hypothetical protein
MAIVLNSKTYNFIGFDKNGVSVYQETSAGVPSGFSYLTCRIIPGSAKDPTKVRWRLTMPVVATVDSDCSCAGSVLRQYLYDEGRIDVPSTSTAAERTDFATRLGDLVDTAAYQASITSLVQPSS